MAFSSRVVSWFSFRAASLLPFPFLGSPPLPVYGAHQRQLMIEFGALEIRHWFMYLASGVRCSTMLFAWNMYSTVQLCIRNIILGVTLHTKHFDPRCPDCT